MKFRSWDAAAVIYYFLLTYFSRLFQLFTLYHFRESRTGGIGAGTSYSLKFSLGYFVAINFQMDLHCIATGAGIGKRGTRLVYFTNIYFVYEILYALYLNIQISLTSLLVLFPFSSLPPLRFHSL